MPSVASQWEMLKAQKSGRFKTDKLKFKWRGSWFWLPNKDQAEIRAKVFGKEGVPCTFQWRDDAFYCTIFESDPASEPLASETVSLMQGADQPGVKTTLLGPKRARWEIPESSAGNTITDAGLKGDTKTCFVEISGTSPGVYQLPQSLSVRLLALAEERSRPRDLSFLRGCKLIRPDKETIRVTGQANDEPHVWIVTAGNKVLVEQPETKKSSYKRKMNQALGDQTTQAAEGAGADQVMGSQPIQAAEGAGADQVMGSQTTQADDGEGGGEPAAKRQRAA